MTRVPGLVRMRRRAVFKCSAVWLIVLILAPFTAPFPTYDLGSARAHPWDVQVKDKADSDDQPAVVPMFALAVPAFDAQVMAGQIALHPIDRTHGRHTVLRL